MPWSRTIPSDKGQEITGLVLTAALNILLAIECDNLDPPAPADPVRQARRKDKWIFFDNKKGQ
jgi:hypothetical protein